ncbi:MAG: GTPase HflX [Polyangiaceae bacterium]|nr:GTPase HflX [Polyangiaceae bacterium]
MTQVFGNTSGLAPHAHRTLERIYRRRVPLDAITTPELNRVLAEASQETRRQVGVLVARSGDIEQVIVGDTSKLMLPDVGRLRAAEGRLRGVRLIHTHLFGEELSKDDIVDLVRLRLDLLAAVLLTPEGEPRSIHYAYNVPPAPRSKSTEAERVPPYRTVGPVLVGRLDVNFGELVRSLEDELARSVKALKINEAKDGRAILVHVAEKSKPDSLRHAEERLRELAELARTAGVDVVDTVLQVRDRLDPRHVLGKGKLDEVVLRSAELDAHTLIFDHDLSPSQASSISARTELKVIDRTQLILDIFAQHAESSDGKLQVELAQLKYALPRLAQKDDSLSRLTGGIGGRGPGETKLEIGRRRAKERVSHLESQLKKLSQERQQRRKRRARAAIPIVSVVGYTNAGKSTLLNTLTGAEVITEDKLFATLDPRSRRLRFPEEREVVITDTVGFIRDLPPDLFTAFRATFEEVADATLLLHVVDASDPSAAQHIRTTEELLAELDLAEIPRILVFNKVDRLEPDQRRQLSLRHGDVVLVSAIEPVSTKPLLEKMAAMLAGKWAESALYPAYSVEPVEV